MTKINLPTLLLTAVVLFQTEVTSMFTREQRAFKAKSYERMPWKRSGPGEKLSVVTNDFSLFGKREERKYDLLSRSLVFFLTSDIRNQEVSFNADDNVLESIRQLSAKRR